MTGNDAQGRLADGTLAAIDIKLTGAMGHVLAAEQFGGAFGDKFVAGAVKAPAPDARLHARPPARRSAWPLPAPIDKTPSRTTPPAARPACVWRTAGCRRCKADCARARRCCIPPSRARPIHPADAAVDAARHDGLETDRRQIAFVGNPAALGEVRPGRLNGLRVIGHAFHAAACQQTLLAAGKIE
jgi:hypothetical protein